MNKRQLKKLKQKEFVKLISVIDDRDTLIFEVDYKNMTKYELYNYAQQITSVINNKVLFVPKDIMQLHVTDIPNAIDLLEFLLNQLKLEVK